MPQYIVFTSDNVCPCEFLQTYHKSPLFYTINDFPRGGEEIVRREFFMKNNFVIGIHFRPAS
jgi:hypothetical protein